MKRPTMHEGERAEWRAPTDPLLAALPPPADPGIARAVVELVGLAREIERSRHYPSPPELLEMIERRVTRLKGGEWASEGDGR